jgi:hypothetical protein
MLLGGNLAEDAAVDAAGRACSGPAVSTKSVAMGGRVDRRVCSCGVAIGVLPMEGV